MFLQLKLIDVPYVNSNSHLSIISKKKRRTLPREIDKSESLYTCVQPGESEEPSNQRRISIEYRFMSIHRGEHDKQVRYQRFRLSI